jgi:hypothetical protein
VRLTGANLLIAYFGMRELIATTRNYDVTCPDREHYAADLAVVKEALANQERLKARMRAALIKEGHLFKDNE